MTGLLVWLAAGCGSSGDGARSGSTAPPRSAETTPAETTPAETTPAEVTPQGFMTTTVRLTEPDGSSCLRCVLLAMTTDEHQRGLMGVTSLGGYDGMAFRYETPSSSDYWMKDTVMPLSIGFYASDGRSLATFDMDPCVADPCPSFGPAEPFTVAVEVAQGRLAELGFTATARLELLGTPCAGELRTG